jgi:hypothetical protein
VAVAASCSADGSCGCGPVETAVTSTAVETAGCGDGCGCGDTVVQESAPHAGDRVSLQMLSVEQPVAASSCADGSCGCSPAEASATRGHAEHRV